MGKKGKLRRMLRDGWMVEESDESLDEVFSQAAIESKILGVPLVSFYRRGVSGARRGFFV